LESKEGIKCLAAYSLGGFCFGLSKRRAIGLMHYGYGIIAKVTVGRLKSDPEKYAIGDIEWQFVECFPDAEKQNWIVGTTDSLPYFSEPT